VESLIVSLLQNWEASSVTNLFIGLIFVVFLFSLVSYLKGKCNSFVHQSSTILTSLGILGTFIGIVIGLLNFDSNDIDGSIPLLLEGLKVAFISSFVGMFFSILLKIILSLNFVKHEATAENEEDVDAKDLLQVLNNIYDALHKADNSSVLGQIKLLRSDTTEQLKMMRSEVSDSFAAQKLSFNEFQESLWVKLQDFADMLSKSATEQVIQALKEVISDFNNNLTEQFGDNFKKLNESVEKLVEWQENYKQQLGEMTEQYQRGIESIEHTKNSVHAISQDTENIPVVMESLSKVIEVNQHQLNELSNHLEAFKEIRDKAVNAVPEIQGQIDKIINGVEQATVDLSKGLSESSDALSKAIIDSSEDFKTNVNTTNAAMLESATALTETTENIKTTLQDALEDMQNNTSNIMNEFVTKGKEVVSHFEQSGQVLFTEAEQARKTFEMGMNQAKDQIINSLEEISQAQQNEVHKVLNSMSRQFEEAVRDTGEAVQKQINMIDESMGEEVSRVMSEMGRALSSISGQFTTDYQKLVTEMASIVRAR
jgi:chromosome segregation ATPase/uncharacterized membrane protein